MKREGVVAPWAESIHSRWSTRNAVGSRAQQGSLDLELRMVVLTKLKKCRVQASGAQAGVRGAQVGLLHHSPASLDERALVRWNLPLLSSSRGPGTLGCAAPIPALPSLCTGVRISSLLLI